MGLAPEQRRLTAWVVVCFYWIAGGLWTAAAYLDKGLAAALTVAGVWFVFAMAVLLASFSDTER